MKPVFLLFLTIVFVLAACVPIPDEPPPSSSAKGGLADLANVIASWDEESDGAEYQAEAYLDVLVEFEMCMSSVEDIRPPVMTDSEFVAMIVYMAGMMTILTANEKDEQVAAGEIESPWEEGFEDGTQIRFQSLLWVLEMCYED